MNGCFFFIQTLDLFVVIDEIAEGDKDCCRARDRGADFFLRNVVFILNDAFDAGELGEIAFSLFENVFSLGLDGHV